MGRAGPGPPCGKAEVLGNKSCWWEQVFGQRIPKAKLLPGEWTETDGQRPGHQQGLRLIRSKARRSRSRGWHVEPLPAGVTGLVGPAVSLCLGRLEASALPDSTGRLRVTGRLPAAKQASGLLLPLLTDGGGAPPGDRVTRQEVTLHRAKLGTNLGSPTYQAGGSGASHPDLVAPRFPCL